MKTIECQVLVAGGGPAGVCAAIAAARNGADVLLVEQYGALGGMPAVAGVSPLMTFHAKDGTQVIRGIPDEIIRRMMDEGYSPGHVRDTIGDNYSVTLFDPEGLKCILFRMCMESGVKLLLHTFLFGVERTGNVLSSVRGANKDGEIRIIAERYIDATGDADLAAWSGCGFDKGRVSDGELQPATMNFTLDNVDFEKVRLYMKENPDEFHGATTFDQLDEPPNGVSGFFKQFQNGKTEMGLDISRDRVLFFRTSINNVATINTTRIIGVDGTNPDDLTRAEIEGRFQVEEVAKLFRKYIPGFENSVIRTVGEVIGIRETRRIHGIKRLTIDRISRGEIPEDTISMTAYGVDIHSPDGEGLDVRTVPVYGIPYGALVPAGIDNLIVTGRTISSDHESQSSLRTCPSCMAIGQAGGTAAAISLKEGLPMQDVDYRQLRQVLRENGAWLGD